MDYLKKISIFSIYLLFTFGCSESEVISSSESKNYVPFTPAIVPALKTDELKKLDAWKNYISVKPGEFWMGSSEGEPGRNNDETKHLVRITRPFWISKFELTKEEWNMDIPPMLRRGSRVYELRGKELKKICIGSKFLDGNYTIREYKQNSRKRYFFEEVIPNVGAKGNWELKLKNRRSYQIKNQQFLKLFDIFNYLNKQNITLQGLLGEKNPITHVSYSQVTSFCWKRTTDAHQNSLLPKGLVFRLPTEAEWEYACRSGTQGFCGLDSGERLSGLNACLDGSRPENNLGGEVMLINRKKIAPINVSNPKYPPNAWGIHDMHGNVMEWCHDFYSPYSTKPLNVDPLGIFNGSRRVVRGGSFYRTAHQCRSASRASYEPSYRGSEIGFRMVIGYPLL